MNELKFNSQICTTREQSQRLLDLGLKPETADMILIHNIFSNTYEPLPKAFPTDTKCYIPAWSLHRLMEISGMDSVNNIPDAYEEVICSIVWDYGEGLINPQYFR